MVQDAESHADEDKKRRELVEARNQAEVLLYSTEKNLEEHGDKVPEAERGQIETDMQALRDVKDGEDTQAIRSAVETLAQSAMKLGEAMYKASQEAEATETTEAPESAEEGPVVDADFEEVDDEKKENEEKKEE